MVRRLDVLVYALLAFVLLVLLTFGTSAYGWP